MLTCTREWNCHIQYIFRYVFRCLRHEQNDVLQSKYELISEIDTNSYNWHKVTVPFKGKLLTWDWIIVLKADFCSAAWGKEKGFLGKQTDDTVWPSVIARDLYKQQISLLKSRRLSSPCKNKGPSAFLGSVGFHLCSRKVFFPSFCHRVIRRSNMASSSFSRVSWCTCL